MTASKTLRSAAALMREQHGPSCQDRQFVRDVAAWFECVAIDEGWEPESAARVRERSTAVRIAEGYLARQEVRA